ncbi:MAG: peptidoglycan DD-metalloendopeptidase family protein [Bacillota bacterium]|nr:peptidoglycan DD-metalloendopeptidase family protein [Bacillota bacterium]
MLKAWLLKKRITGFYFAVSAAALLLLMMGTYNYLGNYVYVVFLDDREVGIVEDASDVEGFINDLTSKCGELYGMAVHTGTKIDLVREFRPDSKPEPEAVMEALRSQLSLITDAYMITVEGKPLVPVASEKDLETVISYLKTSYIRDSEAIKILDINVVENLGIESCSVNPDNIYSAEEVASLLVENSKGQPMYASFFPEITGRGALINRSSFSDAELGFKLQDDINPSQVFNGSESDDLNELVNAEVTVKIVEEVTVTEPIPFNVEYTYDSEMWIVQNEILNPGKEGKKEIIYHVTRENGQEIERIKLSESIIEEPVTQVEVFGTAKVPSIGSGQFIWPVESGGEVTPGRGFSTWHTGIDINAPSGTNILAADSGIVWFSGYGGSQGNYLILYHGSYWTLYLHNKTNLVSEGTEVRQGDLIALLGSTGRSTGPHLHFEVRLDDGSGEWLTYYQHKPVDPLQFFHP